MNKFAVFVLLPAMVLAAGNAAAQGSRERLIGAASQAPDLQFPAAPEDIASVDQPRMAVFKPDGAGPFPAIVLHHQCGGLRSANGRWQNMSMLEWAKLSVAKGYAVLLLDAFQQRDVDTVCMGPKNGVNFYRAVKDAHQAADHLRSFPFVDPERVFWAGYSWGAMSALFGSSKSMAEALGSGRRFRAAVAHYPGCFTIRPPNGQPYEMVRPDIDRPFLALLGEEDTETPAKDCIEKLGAAQKDGAPVAWHLYPKTTHCWDCANLDGRTKTDIRGNAVLYRYSREATEDSAARMFQFFAANGGK